eukprot:62252_1
MNMLQTYILVVYTLLFFGTSAQTECDDHYQCGNQIIDTTEDVECYGFDACDGSSITTTASLNCNGYEGCSQTKYLYGDPVNCGGQNGCFMADQIESPSTIACDGYFSCYSASTLTAPKVECYGRHSCQDVDSIVASVSVNAIGAQGIYDVPSVTTAVLACTGTLSCAKIGKISSAQVISAGVMSLKESSIDSDGLAAMEVMAVGYHSAYQASIYCRVGSECTITCFGTGCVELYVYYEGSASQVTTDPVQCKLPKNRGGQINDKTWATWCPYIVSASEMTLTQFEEMKQERMRTIVHKDAVAMIQSLEKNAQPILEKRLQYKSESEYALVSNGLVHVPWWSSNNLVMGGSVLGVFMMFACCYAYRKGKEYEVLI